MTAGTSFTCAVIEDLTTRCWGVGSSGQLARGSIQPYGGAPGQVPAALPEIQLGGQRFGRDADGDGVRDALDACPTGPGTLPDGCTAAPAPPEATLKGSKVVIDTVLAKTKASAKCPKKATVVVRTRTAKGKVSVTKQLTSRAATGGCRVKGKVKLPAKPTKKAKVKVTISGKKLKTKHLVAIRA